MSEPEEFTMWATCDYGGPLSLWETREKADEEMMVALRFGWADAHIKRVRVTYLPDE